MLIYERRCFTGKNEILRNQRWRLGIIRHAEEVTQNIAKTCRYFGISITTFYRWYKRYKKYGGEGLKNRSHWPIHSPNSTKPEIIVKIGATWYVWISSILIWQIQTPFIFYTRILKIPLRYKKKGVIITNRRTFLKGDDVGILAQPIREVLRP